MTLLASAVSCGRPGDAERQGHEAAARQQGAGDQRTTGQQRPAKSGGEHRHDRADAEEGVVHEETDHPAAQGCERAHREAPASIRATDGTASSPTSRNIAANATRARSWPGQATPSPSPVQKTPNAESITPTPNFKVFSGTRVSGRCRIRPMTRTRMQAASARS